MMSDQYQGLYGQPADPPNEKAPLTEGSVPNASYQTTSGPRPVPNVHVEDDHFTTATDTSRDRINEFVQVNFDDIIQEQNGTSSIEACKPVNATVYTHTKNIWYKFLSTLTGIFLAVMWGLTFATVAYIVNWVWGPFIQLTKMFIYMGATIYRYCLRAFLDPFYESVSKVFSNIRVSFHSKPPLYSPAVTHA